MTDCKNTTAAADSRGILHPEAACFHLDRYAPSAELVPFVERYWIIRWSLPPGTSRIEEVLSYPSVDLVFERGRARVWGPQTERLTRRFAGSGQVLGVKFKPGGFFPFTRVPMTFLANRSVSVSAAFDGCAGRCAAQLARSVETESNHKAVIDMAERFLRERLPAADPSSQLAAQFVSLALHDWTRHDRTDADVKCLAAQMQLSVRSLQRLFRRYVGVSPKWVLQRFRLMDVLAQFGSSGVSCAAIAADFGYSDQAHLIHDFRPRIGVTPARYRRHASDSLYGN